MNDETMEPERSACPIDKGDLKSTRIEKTFSDFEDDNFSKNCALLQINYL
jgi:hypothetical protein